MCARKITVLSLITLFCLINYSIAQEAKQVTFTGKVDDAQGQPIAGAIVKFYDGKYTQSMYTADIADAEEIKSDTNGEFSIIKKTNYPYGHIVVEKEGLALDCAEWNKRESLEFQFRLGEPKELTGIVVDENGKPVSDAQVGILMLVIGSNEERHLLDSNASAKILNTRTDSTGKFSFMNLPADAKVEFLVQKAGYATISTFKRAVIPNQSLQFSPGQKDIKIIQPAESRIEGVVVDKDTGKPVAGINLLLRESQNYTVYGQNLVTSGDNGAFTISGVSAGSYNIIFAMPQQDISDWVAQPVSVTLEAGQTKKDVKVELEKGGFLEAILTDVDNSKPLEGAGISLYSNRLGQSFSGSSNKDGIARIRLLPGVYTSITAYKQDYSSIDQQDAITIVEGSIKRLEFQLNSMPALSGIVSDESGKPVKGAKLLILAGSSSEIESDSEGKYEISWDDMALPAMVIQRDMPLLVCRYVEGNLATAFTVDKATKTLDIKLKPGVTIIGKVIGSDGKSIEGAGIRIMLRQTMMASTFLRNVSIKTDAEGNFEIKAVPADQRYQINVNANGYGSKQIDTYANNAINNILDVEPLTLPIANLTVSGQVVDTEGNPLANARIESRNFEGGQPESLLTQTDSQGKFILKGVCEGKVNVRANVTRTGKSLSAIVYTNGGASDIKIVAREGQAAVQYIRTETYEQIIQKSDKVIAGLVVDEKGSPVAGLNVVVCCKKTQRENGKFTWMFGDFSSLSNTTDKQGRFAIALEEDAEYNLLFSPDNYAATIVYDVPAGKKDLKVVLEQGGSISGQLVRMEKSKKVPIANAEVKIEQESRAAYTHLGFDRDRTLVTDAQGRFKFEHIQTKIRPGNSRTDTEWEPVPRVWVISYGDITKTVAFNDGTEINDFELVANPEESQLSVGKPLPGFDGINIKFSEEQTKGKRILVCFFDYGQRPSRNCIIQLNTEAKELITQGVEIIAVQTSKIEQDTLDKWVKDNNISFPIGMIEAAKEKTSLAWGVKSLPWLILTDKEHVVTAEGFAITELDEKIRL
jgi:uncharacterized GH25 family protein